MYHLQKADGSHNFKEDISFNNIVDTYNFDKKLRFLTLSYLERIEVAMRALITYNYSISKGFFWYTDCENFVKPSTIPDDIREKIEKGQSLPRKYINTHDYILKSIKESFANSSDLFATKFKLKYTSESLPPCNIALELVSMGCISRLYEALTNCDEKQAIAGMFSLPNNVLSSWLTFLTNVRNICAHHSRLWNRKMTADRFIIPSKKSIKFNGSVPDDFDRTYYGVISIMIRLLSKINPENSFEVSFKSLIKDYPNININYMGFPDD